MKPPSWRPAAAVEPAGSVATRAGQPRAGVPFVVAAAKLVLRREATAMVVSEIMTRDPITAEATATVAEIMALLHEIEVRHVPIMDGDQLVGIVSDRDLRSFLVPDLVAMDRPDETSSRLSAAVSTVMASDVLSVESESDVGDAVDIMLEQRVGAIPVVAPGSRDLVGILSYVDVLRAVRDLL